MHSPRLVFALCLSGALASACSSSSDGSGATAGPSTGNQAGGSGGVGGTGGSTAAGGKLGDAGGAAGAAGGAGGHAGATGGVGGSGGTNVGSGLPVCSGHGAGVCVYRPMPTPGDGSLPDYSAGYAASVLDSGTGSPPEGCPPGSALGDYSDDGHVVWMVAQAKDADGPLVLAFHLPGAKPTWTVGHEVSLRFQLRKQTSIGTPTEEIIEIRQAGSLLAWAGALGMDPLPAELTAVPGAPICVSGNLDLAPLDVTFHGDHATVPPMSAVAAGHAVVGQAKGIVGAIEPPPVADQTYPAPLLAIVAPPEVPTCAVAPATWGSASSRQRCLRRRSIPRFSRSERETPAVASAARRPIPGVS